MKIMIEEISYPIHPEKVFAYHFQPSPYAFWLDGNCIVKGLSRYSFMGANPRFILKTNQGITQLIHSKNMDTCSCAPFLVIKQVLDDYQGISVDSSLPFLAGLIGYFGYEMNQYSEQVPVHPTLVPESMWMFVDQVLIYDQVEKKAWLSRLVMEESEELARKKLEEEIKQIIWASMQDLADPSLDELDDSDASSMFVANETKESYLSKMEKLKNYIGKGDIYQVCFTYQITTSYEEDPFELYRILRRINPAPFASYLKFEDLSILSSSPERFLKLDAHGVLESRPIKGTRPRSSDYNQDQAYIHELKTSEKECAENVMIVDLVRNDLGRVCLTGHVQVPTLLNVESYATVHQLVSTVTGKLRPDVHPIDAIQAAFPGGSMTGAPKIRAMEILHELENSGRGIYAGGLGYLDVRGMFDLSMVIRTIVCQSGQASFHVGGGIVADSVPEMEYKETEVKAYALKKAIMYAKTSYVK
ncbi:aminodeoxychorismate synthase component I [Thermoflavimicrobium dichotomicum]|uniref:aminodeoxychorismate synthase n=1 Tax=Thermoflavimicrobium dichotomicum TaxID=46223 RepID=A0A1I3JF21_9BACL|nr:aminodeoxychorismate synthase component I [Thermoflavimicrobium dichotomicum]SFI58746.1 para-aminobenzoate synthetase component 1/para-aminobenzoate synthetase [Thermoflavimicrobium dichotomicum]